MNNHSDCHSAGSTAHPFHLRLSWVTATLLALCASLTQWAHAQCAAPSDIRVDMLIGLWDVTLHSSPPQKWQMKLNAHPEHIGSLNGVLEQSHQRKVWIVADWDDNEFTLEESGDGQRIDATWQGTATPGLCGQQLEGQRWPSAASSNGASNPLRWVATVSKP